MGITGTRAGGRAAGGRAAGKHAFRRTAFRTRRSAGVCAYLLAVASASAWAETWRVDPSVGVQETLTNNVNLSPSSTRQGDLVTQLTPGFTIQEKGSHSSLLGTVAVPLLFYIKTGAENNTAYVQADILGTTELVDRLLFVEGAVNVSQQFFTPFGAQPSSLSNATNNRYTTQSYRVSPYLKGEAGNNISYLLRDDNIWTNLSGAPLSTNNSYTNQVIGMLRRDPVPFGWQVDYNRNDVRFTDQSAQLMELERIRVLYDPDPVLELGASGGYERNDFPLSSYSGATYGVSGRWRPNERTSLDGFYEHRFFGTSFGLTFDYRTPLSVWGVRASRNITTYPQQIAALPATGNVSALLNNLFLSRITDPAERQTAVDNLIRDRGLPQTLNGPVNLYSQQVTLQEQVSATFGLLGARNTVFFNVFYLKSTPIAGSGQALPPILAGFNTNDNAQTGASAVWTHKLTELLSFNGSLNWTRTVANPPFDQTTNQGSVQTALTAPISAHTTVFGGARYQLQTSNIPTLEYREVAGFVGLNYAFH